MQNCPGGSYPVGNCLVGSCPDTNIYLYHLCMDHHIKSIISDPPTRVQVF